MHSKDFDPSKILKVSIDKVEPNDYNPKKKETDEYKKVVESLKLNGLKQPIFVRQIEGNDNFVIVDGEQRYTAAKELGYTEVYVYNLGFISEEEAKALTIWMEVQVPFEELQLAALVTEMKDLDFELPYTEEEIADYVAMAGFDFSTSEKEDKEEADDGLIELNIRMTKAQYDFVESCLKAVSKKYDCDEAKALYMLFGGVDE